MRSDVSNLRTLLFWARICVSMIGLGFMIYNFYHGFLEEVGGTRGQDAARNLGLALDGSNVHHKPRRTEFREALAYELDRSRS